MTAQNKETIIDRARAAGCWAQGLWAGAFFFLLGMLVSLLNGEVSMALQALIIMLLLVAVSIVILRRK